MAITLTPLDAIQCGYSSRVGTSPEVIWLRLIGAGPCRRDRRGHGRVPGSSAYGRGPSIAKDEKQSIRQRLARAVGGDAEFLSGRRRDLDLPVSSPADEVNG